MKTPWDGRHRWGDVIEEGGTISRTCRACGRIVTYEVIIPRSVLHELMIGLTTPNVWRMRC